MKREHWKGGDSWLSFSSFRRRGSSNWFQETRWTLSSWKQKDCEGECVWRMENKNKETWALWVAFSGSSQCCPSKATHSPETMQVLAYLLTKEHGALQVHLETFCIDPHEQRGTMSQELKEMSHRMVCLDVWALASHPANLTYSFWSWEAKLVKTC